MNPDFVTALRTNGLDWPAYRDEMERAAAVDPATLAGEAAERAEFSKLNLHRTERILRTWRPSADLEALVGELAGPQTWLVLTEAWCGDSAQCLPMIVRLAELAPDVTLRILLRDDNLEVMDRYLTDGKRAIPKLAAFDAEGAELFRWGARPAAAQAVMDEAVAEGLAKADRLERLHLFYGRDRGRALDAEFVALLSAHRKGAP
jgi:hypothetical protein